MQGEQTIRVAIVEDDGEIREGLCALINGTAGFSCRGSFSAMEPALAGIAADPPDVALIDLDLPGMSGIDGIRELRKRSPTVSPLVLTVHSENDRLVQALCNGANGYLLKNTPPARLLEAIKESVSGGSPMSPEIARSVVELFRRFQQEPESSFDLNPHEKRILQFMADGESFRSVAGRLSVTVHTVSYHVRGIYEKLHVHSRSDAVAKALRSGLLK
jgi:DNA-binding NarL/FixJ family response regulator